MSTHSILKEQFELTPHYDFNSNDELVSVSLCGNLGIILYLKKTFYQRKQSYAIGGNQGEFIGHVGEPITFLTDVLKELTAIKNWIKSLKNSEYVLYSKHSKPIINIFNRYYIHGENVSFKEWFTSQCEIDNILTTLKHNNNIGGKIVTVRKYDNSIIISFDSKEHRDNMQKLIEEVTTRPDLEVGLTMIALPHELDFTSDSEYFLEIKGLDVDVAEALRSI